MERDFMGLTVKEEVLEEPVDPAPIRSSAMQWSFSNNISVHPRSLSFKGAQEERPKTGFDSLASAGLVTITTTEAVDSSHRPYSGVTQKNMMLEKQGGTHFSGFPPHHYDVHSVDRSHGVRVLPAANPPNQISVSMTMPGHKSFISPVGQNLVTTVNPHTGGGAPVSSLFSTAPTSSAVVGTTDLRGAPAPKITSGPAQLTIFYAGSVCVYDNVSPEKAQAIMLLAGNVPSVTPIITSTQSPVHAPIPKPSAVESFVVNQCHNTTPTLSSPISIAPHGGSQAAGVSGNTNGTTIIKSMGVMPSPSFKAEPSIAASPIRSFPPSLVPSAVPQARKASLARFLEKRKERVISASPYSISKQPQESSTPGFSRSLSMNSSGSCPPHVINLVKET